MQLTPEQLAQLTGQMECFIHTHPKEPLGPVDYIDFTGRRCSRRDSGERGYCTVWGFVRDLDTSAFAEVSNGGIWSSPASINWTQRYTVSSSFFTFTDGFWDGNTFFLIGNGAFTTRYRIFASVDGVNWISANHPSTSILSALVNFRDRLFILGQSGQTLTSPNINATTLPKI